MLNNEELYSLYSQKILIGLTECKGQVSETCGSLGEKHSGGELCRKR
jgi:hypothetical protein